MLKQQLASSPPPLGRNRAPFPPRSIAPEAPRTREKRPAPQSYSKSSVSLLSLFLTPCLSLPLSVFSLLARPPRGTGTNTQSVRRLYIPVKISPGAPLRLSSVQSVVAVVPRTEHPISLRQPAPRAHPWPSLAAHDAQRLHRASPTPTHSP